MENQHVQQPTVNPMLVVSLDKFKHDKLVIFTAWDQNLQDVPGHLPLGYSGKVLVDTMCAMGAKAEDRFVSMQIEHGILVASSMRVVAITAHNHVRKYSNESLCKHRPDALENSVLASLQKRMLMRGLSL